MSKILEKLEQIILIAVVLFTPLAVSSVFPNPFILPKLMVLVICVSLVILLRAIRTLVSGSFTLHTGKFDLAVLVLAVVYIVSAILKTPNKMEAFFLPGGVTFVVAGALYYFLAGGIEKKTLKFALYLTGVIYSVFTLLAFLGVLGKIPQLPAFAKDLYFSLNGSTLVSAILMATVLPLGVASLLTEKEVVKKLFSAVSLAVLILGLGISIYTMLPGKAQSPQLPALNTSWSIAVEALKVSPLLGVGTGNYLTAFNLYRPISYNATPLWNVRFSSANNFYFNLITEAGLLGLAAAFILLFSLYKVLKRNMSGEIDLKIEGLSLVILVLSTFLFPTDSLLIFVLLVLLAAFAQFKEVDLKLSTNSKPSLPAAIVAIPLIIGVLALGYFGQRAVLAEYKFQQALTLLTQNDGKGTYDKLREVLSSSPYVDRYHATYAQVNLALVNALAQKKDLTDADKTTITQLVQQAIREGKATVTLNPQRANNWEVLARIYQSIIPIAQGSDTFAIQAYSQAVNLDPLNANLRIALGGVYYALGRYDEAIQTFQTAVLSKPDLANAHYNLAIAHREKGEIQKAIDQMNAVLSLVSKDSKDYEVAQAELENLQKKLPAEKATGESLTPPPSTQNSTVKPKITLPQEANPPAQP